MEKSPQAFRTISEVSEVVGVPAHVLRFWEGKFAQIKPVKRGGGRRYYRPQDVELITAIRELLYTDGLTIRGVQKLFKEHGVKHVVARHGIAPAPMAPTDDDDQTDAAQLDAGAAEEDDDLWNDVPDAGLIAPMEEAAPMAEQNTTPAPTAKPDPARAAAMRSVLTRLESLRARMAAHPTPDLAD
ncbi:MerR family transcriptional regulator [Pontivivens insulae]|uniref:HTH merR-type domain-containing protein n=1 Tax=Pontivivens insulae TaxID=1639689 RepID=A0A2R8AC97_9RHOB|nr:MerR family transcriptional regulator [Pontivivens insulae]RED13829.1 MerR-like DNA binding protein [Pontivivens insulae]SPF29903.1 hypothetical protein POI8812_02228 [Pontivivens insulae]